MIAVIKEGNEIKDVILDVTGIHNNIVVTKRGRIMLPERYTIETKDDNPNWKTDKDIKDFTYDSFGRVLNSKLKEAVINDLSK